MTKLKPVRYLRECGHPNDWTLSCVELDGTLTFYCYGCIIEKCGLKPVARYQIGEGNELIPLPLEGKNE